MVVPQCNNVVRLGLIGLGTVGSGVATLLQRNHKIIEHRAECRIELSKVAVQQLDKPRPVTIAPSVMTTDPLMVVNDPEIDVVVELMGGLDTAFDYAMTAIRNGKSLVTANKELLARRGSELLDAAKKYGVDLLFEASVAGGIPLIAALKESLVGNHIQEIIGILNGTTNYILTRMTQSSSSLNEALAEAQAKGFAETDPSDDVDGYDAMYKISILGAIAFGYRLNVDDVHCEGIRSIEAADIAYAETLGYVVKLLAVAKQDGGKIELRVHPALVPKNYPLAAVSDNYNGVVAEGDAVGRLMFYGQGAGAEPTASAVMGDIVNAARNISKDARGRVSCVCHEQPIMKPIAEVESRFCVRMSVLDKPGVLAKIANVFGNEEVSLATVEQSKSDRNTAEIVWITHRTPYAAIRSSLAIINGLDVVDSVRSVLWIEGE